MARIRVTCGLQKQDGGFVEYQRPRVFVVLEDGTEEECFDVVRLMLWAEVNEVPRVLLEVMGAEIDVMAETLGGDR